MEKNRLGKITGAVGLKGELRVYPFTDFKELFEEISYVLMDDTPFSIKAVRYMKGLVILKLTGIDDRSAAENCRGKEIFMYRKDVPPLPEGTYYVKDLIGLIAVDEEGRKVGRLCEVIINTAQDIYMIEPFEGGNPFPIPAVEEFIKIVDIEKGIIGIKLIDGLREL